MSTGLITTLLGLVLPALTAIITAWFKSSKSDAAIKREGENEANRAANKESTDALIRMSQANAEPRSRAVVIDRLRNGAF